MTLSLDHQGRLNLSTLIGIQECKTIAETRAAWKLMDKLALSDAEKQAIGFSLQMVNGSEMFSWSPDKSLPAIDYEFSDSEAKQIQDAINRCPRFMPAMMRRWLEPILERLPAAPDGVQLNGAAPAAVPATAR